MARWVVIGGGMAVIAGILGILLFILVEVAPLLGGAAVQPRRTLPLAGDARAVLVDEYRTHAALLSPEGTIRVIDLDDGRTVLERTLIDADRLAPRGLTGVSGRPLFLAATQDGRLLVQRVVWDVSFEGAERVVRPELPPAIEIELDPAGRAPRAFTAAAEADGTLTAAAVLADGRTAVVRRRLEENFLTGETSAVIERLEGATARDVEQLALSREGRDLFGADASERLLWWRLSDEAGLDRPDVVEAGGGGVLALTLLLGDRSLVAGHRDGTLSVWFPVRQADETFRLTRIRDLSALHGEIRHLAPSGRNKGFLAVDSSGGIGLFHSTSSRTLWTGRAPRGPVSALTFAPRADGAFLAAPSALIELTVDNPHPEVGLRALFAKVWYEGYPAPDHVWQSSGGSDEFEPKLGLTPLIVGTLKGTLYSLILAVPLGVLAAMYASQFMHAALRRYVKPAVEIMAALPSVVLGFLAGLWLAPRIESVFPALLLMAVLLPALVVAGGLLWRRLPRGLRQGLPDGMEAFLHVGIVALGFWICVGLNDPVEALLFGDSFREWLAQATGLGYDQRNAVVVGLAMGFAVIPIIFSIAEDAFSNVPRNLVSGSLALGATRWQTVTRVVLPSASPGIFSAIMIGFGRAVGETMIVLMATGNTPIMDWSPFNGFRTLSANIAVEIPEAPQGGTLYRTLFLAALILFVFTFLTNTLAEVVRQRLRRRYAQP